MVSLHFISTLRLDLRPPRIDFVADLRRPAGRIAGGAFAITEPVTRRYSISVRKIATVLSALTIEFLNGAGVVATADLGLEVEKVGRTTEHTASTVTEIDATVMINYGSVFAPDMRTFDDQIVTGPMSQGGDSGSVVYRVQ